MSIGRSFCVARARAAHASRRRPCSAAQRARLAPTSTAGTLSAHGLGQGGQGEARSASEAEVAREAADGVSTEQGILRHLDDRRFRPRGLELWKPGRVGLDDHDHVGGFEVRRRIEARVERMVLGKIHVRWCLLEHRHAERLGQGHQ
jgi:hypothetical protein